MPSHDESIENAQNREASKEALQALKDFETQPVEEVTEPKEEITPPVETADTGDTKTETVTEPTSTEEVKSTESEESGEPMTTEERMGLLEKELKLRDLQDEKRNIQIDKWKTLAQTRAGEVNHLRKSGNRTDDSSVDYNTLLAELQTEEPAEQVTNTRDNDRIALLEQEATERAKQDAIMRFYSDNKIDDDTAVKIAEIIPNIAADYEHELGSGSAIKVKKATTNLLKEASIMVREQSMVAELEEARKRRVAVTETARKRKIESASSTSSTSSGTQTIDLSTANVASMSTDDLRKALAAEDKKRGR